MARRRTRGRDEVPRRQGRRAVRDGVGQPRGHVQRRPLRVRLRRHPHVQEQPRHHDRVPARGTDVSKPTSASNLDELGAIDSGQAPITGATTTTVAGTHAGRRPTASAVAGDARRRSPGVDADDRRPPRSAARDADDRHHRTADDAPADPAARRRAQRARAARRPSRIASWTVRGATQSPAWRRRPASGSVGQAEAAVDQRRARRRRGRAPVNWSRSVTPSGPTATQQAAPFDAHAAPGPGARWRGRGRRSGPARCRRCCPG